MEQRLPVPEQTAKYAFNRIAKPLLYR